VVDESDADKFSIRCIFQCYVYETDLMHVLSHV